MDKTWMVGLFSGSMCKSRETASRRGRGTKGNITWTCSSSCGNKEEEDNQVISWKKGDMDSRFLIVSSTRNSYDSLESMVALDWKLRISSYQSCTCRCRNLPLSFAVFPVLYIYIYKIIKKLSPIPPSLHSYLCNRDSVASFSTCGWSKVATISLATPSFFLGKNKKKDIVSKIAH